MQCELQLRMAEQAVREDFRMIAGSTCMCRRQLMRRMHQMTQMAARVEGSMSVAS